jgi:hypothetical protein
MKEKPCAANAGLPNGFNAAAAISGEPLVGSAAAKKQVTTRSRGTPKRLCPSISKRPCPSAAQWQALSGIIARQHIALAKDDPTSPRICPTLMVLHMEDSP